MASVGFGELEQVIITRLDRLESKMDKMAEAVIALARTEERVIRLMEADGKKTEWLKELQDRVNTLEKNEAETNAVSRRVERVFWIGATAAFSLIVGLIIAWARVHV